MAYVQLRGVSVDFPMYHASARSMRRYALAGALGGNLRLTGRVATVTALSGIDLELRDGDRLALTGANGAGKSTLLRTMAGIYAPTAGSVRRSGRMTPLLGRGTGLDLEATGLENILLLGMHLDIAPAEMRRSIDEIVDWTELGAFIAAPLRTYSAGMVMRLAFAVSTARAPELLLMDEWLGVADAEFQGKAQQRMARFVDQTSVVVLASHSPPLLRAWCRSAVRLEHGRIAAAGTLDELVPPA